MSNEIHIGRPYIKEMDNSVRLCADINICGDEKTAWFSVPREYGEYLTDDRGDAFVAGIFTTAMRNGADIISEAPVTRRVLYQLNHYLIPMMSSNMGDTFHAMKVRAEATDVRLSCAGAVATGWTGGVDCLFTLMKHIDSEEPSRRLTHLVITSDGCLEDKDNSALLKKLVEKAEAGIAKDTGLKILGIDTNLQDIQTEHFLSVSSFRHSAVALAMQKLFGVFLWSSGYEFARFAFSPVNCQYYELVIFSSFETDSTVLYSAGGAYSRTQKLQALSEYPLAHKYLHPCIDPLPADNCGKCGKCVRTIGILNGLGILDKFSEVFDIDDIRSHEDWYMAQLLANGNNQHCGEALFLLKQRGIEPSDSARRMARIIKAAKKTVGQNKDFLSGKLLGE